MIRPAAAIPRDDGSEASGGDRAKKNEQKLKTPLLPSKAHHAREEPQRQTRRRRVLLQGRTMLAEGLKF